MIQLPHHRTQTPPAKYSVGDLVRVHRPKLEPFEGRVTRITWRDGLHSKGHYLYFIKTASVFGADITRTSGEDKLEKVGGIQ